MLNSNDNNVRTSCNDKDKKIRTYVLESNLFQHLKVPIPFQQFAPDQQQDVLKQLVKLDKTIQQAVLDEWAIRCQKDYIRSPVGYLFRIISKAQQGLFHPNAGIGVDYQDEQQTLNHNALDKTKKPLPPKQLSDDEPLDYKDIAKRHLPMVRQLLGKIER